ncbi:hypothetical protein JOC37_001577 [Desulfohalotomaculum tongense]|uniref:hypothetical protein n=1 Tax=Desulforadius tongensis TaxID=1216062 RepID=UPI001959C57F|nr:hypothetical protein [Desulforadius tongensis]MBM7855192.1 hypothetical protein [Desulforadius tongensis]
MNFYDQKDDSILEPNAYTLFLILILLVLSTNREFEERLSYVSSVIKSGHNAVKMMRAGMNEFHSSMRNNNYTHKK